MKTNVKTTSFFPDGTLTVVASGILTVDAVMRGKCLMKPLKKTKRPRKERLLKLLLLKKSHWSTTMEQDYWKIITN